MMDCGGSVRGPACDRGDRARAGDEALKAKVGRARLSRRRRVHCAGQGLFPRRCLEIELKFFDAAQPIAVATTSRDMIFGITAFTAGLYNLAGKGTLKVIGRHEPREAGYPLMAISPAIMLCRRPQNAKDLAASASR